MAAAARVLALVLAGGQGPGLRPLTAHRAPAAVPFGGSFRLVDFVLSNLVNAGFRRICVLTQYKSHSLARHITTTWQLNQMLGNFVIPVPAQQRLGPHWYTGSADTVLQSLNLVLDEGPDFVLVLGADQVYRMDPAQLVADHVASGAEATVAGIEVHRTPTTSFGVIDTDRTGRITGLNPDRTGRSARPEVATCYASTGNYVFTTDALVSAVRADADTDSAHDIAADLMPMFVERGTANVYDFHRNQVPGATEADGGYWRHVASLDAFHDAHMDLVAEHPTFNMYNQQWPILSVPPTRPPAKFVGNAAALDCLVGAGTIISGATVHRSVIFDNVHIETGAAVEGSVLFPGARIGRNAQIRNAILDKNAVVPAGATVGIDLAADPATYTVTASGITVIAKGGGLAR